MGYRNRFPYPILSWWLQVASQRNVIRLLNLLFLFFVQSLLVIGNVFAETPLEEPQKRKNWKARNVISRALSVLLFPSLMSPHSRTQGILGLKTSIMLKAASIDFFHFLDSVIAHNFFLNYDKFYSHSLIATEKKACSEDLYFLWELGCGQIGRLILDH